MQNLEENKTNEKVIIKQNTYFKKTKLNKVIMIVSNSSRNEINEEKKYFTKRLISGKVGMAAYLFPKIILANHYITVTQFQYILTISIAWEFATN